MQSLYCMEPKLSFHMYSTQQVLLALTVFPRTPAMSKTRFLMSMTTSFSSVSMPNLARSGLKVMDVQLSLGLQFVIFGSVFLLILLLKTCNRLSGASVHANIVVNLSCSSSAILVSPACISDPSGHRRFPQ